MVRHMVTQIYLVKHINALQASKIMGKFPKNQENICCNMDSNSARKQLLLTVGSYTNLGTIGKWTNANAHEV